MRELATVGLSEDGRFLVTVDGATGEKFRIGIDRRLSNLIDRAPASSVRSGQMEIPMESSLSPREIQARIRRGESVDQVAEIAGVPVDQLDGFATPVLAERAHMVEMARATSVRRRSAGGPPVALAKLADEAIAAHGLVPDQCTWDSWRREDGRWTVRVIFGDSTADFVFDPKSRYVIADDDAAQNLVGDLATQEQHDMALADLIADPTKSAGPHETDPTGEVHSLKEARDRRAQEQLVFDTSEAADTPTDREEAELAESIGHAAQEPKPRKKQIRRSVPSWDEIMFGGQRD